MKKLFIVGMAITTVAFLGCAKSGDGSGSGTARSYHDSPNPYPVSDSERTDAVNELVVARKRMLVLEGKLIAPTTEDLSAYADFLKDANTGLARLFPRDYNNEKAPLLVNGSGAYYTFKTRTNEYGHGSDIQYATYNNTPEFSVGFAGVDYGFFGEIGKTDIRQIDINNPLVVAALSQPSLNNQLEPAWRAEYQKWQAGVTNSGIQLKSRVEAVVGVSYVVRSVDEGGYDIVAAFQVVRRDATDGSLIIAWKIIKEFDKPVLRRN